MHHVERRWSPREDRARPDFHYSPADFSEKKERKTTGEKTPVSGKKTQQSFPDRGWTKPWVYRQLIGHPKDLLKVKGGKRKNRKKTKRSFLARAKKKTLMGCCNLGCENPGGRKGRARKKKGKLKIILEYNIFWVPSKNDRYSETSWEEHLNGQFCKMKKKKKGGATG